MPGYFSNISDYMGDCTEAAYDYKEKADEGMKKDAEETRRIAEEFLRA